MNLDWKHYTVAILLLAVLASWGSREYYHSKELKDVTTAKTTAEEKATKAEARAMQLETQVKTEVSRQAERGKKRIETRLPDGTIQITEEEFDRTLDQAKAEATQKLTEQYEAKLTQQREVVTNLSHEINELEVELKRSAPRWAASTGWMGNYYAGAGMNLGGITAQATYSQSGMLGGVATLRF